jgi:hypothetical protein
MGIEASPAAAVGGGGVKTLIGGTATPKFLTESNTVLNGKWTHSSSGKASIFSTTWLGNPAAV